MKTVARTLMAGVLLAAAGCVTPKDVKVLQADNRRLERELENVTAALARLDGDYKELQQVNAVLESEKAARVEDSTDVRQSARGFIRGQVETLQGFAQSRSLLDYLGGELISRASVEGENCLVVDMKNVCPAPGVLTGARILAMDNTQMAICVLRPQKDRLVVLWMSETLDVNPGTPVSFSFATPIGVQKDDLIGAYAAGPLGVPFDKGTGDTRLWEGAVKVGQAIRVSELKGSQKRAYSFGVVGFLDGSGRD